MGHLLFIPADGSVDQLQEAEPIQAYDLDSPNRVDNVCDGWVKVEVTHRYDAEGGIVQNW